MKNLILISALILSFQASAKNIEGVSKDKSKLLKKIYKCTEKVAKKRKTGTRGILSAAELLKDVRVYIDDMDELEGILNACKVSKRIPARKKASLKKKIKFLNELNIEDKNIKFALKDLIAPVWNCKGADIQVEAGVAIVVTSKTGFYYCENSRGQRRVIAGQSFSGGVGVSFAATAGLSSLWYQRGEFVSNTEAEMEGTNGYGVAIRAGSYENQDVSGVGVGLGFNIKSPQSIFIPVPLIPFTRDWNSFHDRLLSEGHDEF